MLNAVITGLAAYAPDDVLDNEMLSRMVDTSDEWITQRVGIKERRILKNGEGSSYLGIQAVKRLLESTGTDPDEIELLICPTSNPDYRFPSTGSIIAYGAGLKNAYAYDIQAACCGFLVGMQDGASYVRAGLRKKVIVVSAEKMSSMVNYKDRSTCPLFGDASGAVLIEPVERPEIEVGIIDSVFHVDGSGKDDLIFKAGGSAFPATHAAIERDEFFIFQNGRAVYKHAVADMLSSSLTVMERNGLTPETVDWFVPHQANMRIIEAVAQRAGIPDQKVLVNIGEYGNTSAATIPVCLNEYRDKLKPGDKIVLTAFGAGYTYGAMYMVWDMGAKGKH